MKEFWNRVTRIGVDETLRQSEVRFVVLVNTLAIFLSFFELSYVPLYISYLPEIQVFFYIGASIGILNLGTLLLNHYKYYLFARLYFGLLALVLINAFSILLGPDVPMHFFLLESIVVAFFIYPKREKPFMFSVVLLFALSFIGLEIWFTDHTAIIKAEPSFLIISKYFILAGLLVLIVAISYYSYSIINRFEALFEKARQKSENLLLNILPGIIAQRLKATPGRIADNFQEATVLFADICDFSSMAKAMPAAQLVSMLDEVFSEFDFIADKHGVEKIKTIGDAYMAAGGIPVPRADHCEAVANMALDMQRVLRNTISEKYQGVELRIGMHCGPVVAGVIGRRRFSYDLWGETVNTASRMESQGVVNKILVTQDVYEKLNRRYRLEYHGEIEAKGKGVIATYVLAGSK